MMNVTAELTNYSYLQFCSLFILLFSYSLVHPNIWKRYSEIKRKNKKGIKETDREMMRWRSSAIVIVKRAITILIRRATTIIFKIEIVQ